MAVIGALRKQRMEAKLCVDFLIYVKPDWWMPTSLGDLREREITWFPVARRQVTGLSSLKLLSYFGEGSKKRRFGKRRRIY